MQDNIIDYYDYLSQILPPLCRCCLTCFLLYDMNVGQKVYVNTKLKRNSNCYLTLYLFGLGRAVIGLVQLVFFELVYRNQNFRFVKFSTKTDQSNWKSIGFGWISVLVGFSGFFQFPYLFYFLSKKANKEKKIKKLIQRKETKNKLKI